MRVLISTWSAPSHYFPMVPVGWALRCSGHEVIVACQKGFAEVVENTGLPAAVVADDIDVRPVWEGAEEEVRGLDDTAAHEYMSRRALRMFTMVSERITAEVVAFARAWRPDLVLFESRSYSGLVAAARLGVPAVRHLYGPDYTYARNAQEHPAIEEFLTRLGAAGVSPHGLMTIDPCPPGMQVPTVTNRQVIRCVPFNGSGTEPEWLRDRPQGRPRVVVTWGTTFGRAAGHLTPLIQTVSALAALQVEVVVAVSARQRDLVGRFDEDVRVVEAMPLQLLLRHADAIVHQGGAGTTLTSVMAGVPQLVLHSMSDRPFNAARVAACGAGRAVPLGEATPGDIRDAVGELLARPAYREAARRVAAESARKPDPTRVVPVLERLAASGGQEPGG